MKRLTEECLSANTPEARLAEMVQGRAPFRANPFRKRLIMQRLSRAKIATPRWSLRPALGALALVILGGAGIASASYGWFRGKSEPAPNAPGVEQRALPAPPRPTQPRAATAPAPEPTPTPEAVTAASPETASGAAETKSAPQRPRREVRALKQHAREDGEDPSEVLEAIRALRKQGDAARAQVLLNQYLKAHPSGALSEDALVLSIEAALARHDPRASEYAKRYLSRFPHGRFQALAQRVLNAQP